MKKVNYSFSVIYLNNNLTKKYKYHLINRYELLNLKKELENNEIEIYCDCQSKVPLTLSQTKIPFLYPKNRNVKHSSDCCRHPSFKQDLYFENNWNYNPKGNKYVVEVDLINYNNIKTLYDSEYLKKYNESLFNFVARLNLMVWESIIKGSKKSIPNNNNEFMKHLYGFSNNIYLDNHNCSLFELFYNNKSISDIEVKTENYFIYMEFIEVINNYTNGRSLILLKNARDKFVRFYIDTNLLLEKLDKVKDNQKIILSGFIHRESLHHKTYLTINNFCLLPIIEEGLWVLNKKEIVEFKKLIDNNFLFYKPSNEIVRKDDTLTKLIILKDNEKPTVYEVFFKNKKNDM